MIPMHLAGHEAPEALWVGCLWLFRVAEDAGGCSRRLRGSRIWNASGHEPRIERQDLETIDTSLLR